MKNNTSHSRLIKIFAATILSCMGIVSMVFAETSSYVGYQKSSATGSLNSYVQTVGINVGDPVYTTNSASGTSIVNEGNDSSTIGNSLKGYYYNSAFGFFKLNWSENTEENAHIVSSTDKCETNGIGGYGYKVGGYAYSPYSGLIRFDYSSDIFVYYCENDHKFHGNAYLESIGFQSFEGITGDISGTSNILVTDSLIIDPNKELFFYVIK